MIGLGGLTNLIKNKYCALFCATIKYMDKINILFFKSLAFILLIIMGYLGVDVFIVKGQIGCDVPSSISVLSNDNVVSGNFDVKYEIIVISDDSLELYIRNNSIKPYYFWAYEFKNWEFERPDKIIFDYASRSRIYNFNDDLIFDETGQGFDCGTGLGITKIAPFDRFRKKVHRRFFVEKFDVHSLFKEIDNENILNLVDGRTYYIGNQSKEEIEEELNYCLHKYKDQIVELDFSLQVVSYIGNIHSLVVSNKIKYFYSELL